MARLMGGSEIVRPQGFVEDGWGRVADAFRDNFEQHGDVGAACCVYVAGRPVVDLWGGLADLPAGRPWGEDTVALVASTSKGATAICAHMLVERGELDLDAPVVRYWPEFADGGKEEILVRWLLSHQAGLPVIDTPLTFEEVCAWDPVIRALSAQKPLWEPGTEHLYHGSTFGFLVGELVRRITGKSLGRFFADEVVGPLGLSAWIGLPDDVEPRLARPDRGDDPSLGQEEFVDGFVARTGLPAADVARWLEATYGPNGPLLKGAMLGGALAAPSDQDWLIGRAFLAAEIPSGNMVADARSIARMYAATVSEVDGIRLLQRRTVETMSVVQTDKTRMHGLPPELNIPADRSFNMSLGFWRACPPMPWLGPTSFGHPGAGGSVGFADLEEGVGFAYVPNHWSWIITDHRADNLASAVARCVE